MQKVEATSSCFLHPGTPPVINLKETDLYTLESFETLQSQRFRQGMDYYVCVIMEGNNRHVADASSFVKHCIRKSEVVKNPLTNLVIDTLEVYVSSKNSPDFKLYMRGVEVLTAPYHLPIFWNDPSRKKEHRLIFMLEYGKYFEAKDLEKSVQVYTQAAEQGSACAKLKLGTVYSKQGQKQAAIRCFEGALRANGISIKQLLFCAQAFRRLEEYTSTFKVYKLMACQGNLIGIAEVIQRLEAGVGVNRNREEAYEWRKKLPAKWKGACISDFFNYLREINYDLNSTDGSK